MTGDHLRRGLLVALAMLLGLIASAAVAQARSDRSLTLYVETPPPQAAEASKALALYVAESRREPGAGPIRFLREPGRPGRFVVVETWSGADTMARHQAGKARRDMTINLAAILASPIDERVGLPIGPPTAAGGAVHIIAHIDVVPAGQDNAAAWLAELARAARAMPGSIGFEVSPLDGRPNHFQVHQTWSGRAAYDAFVASDASKRFRANLIGVKGAIYDDRLFVPG